MPPVPALRQLVQHRLDGRSRLPRHPSASALRSARVALSTGMPSLIRLIRFKVSNTLLHMNSSSPLLLFAAAVIALFCLRLMVSPQARERDRSNIVTLARRRPWPAVQVSVAILVWLASIAFAVDLAAHIAIEAPEAPRPLYHTSTLAAIFAFTLALLLWNFGTRTVSFFPPDSDRRTASGGGISPLRF